MAQMEIASDSGKRGRRLPANIRIDMTPMVDLGFLLITFFIFTTTMGEKKATHLIMPNDDGPPSILNDKHALTVLLGKSDQVYVYEGIWEEALAQNRIVRSNYNVYEGIGKLIRDKQKQLQLSDNIKSKENLMLLIKPTSVSSYKNVIDALDEASINNVKKYAIVDPSPEEKIYTEK